MAVVIVESPAKAKTINKYLGKDYDVFASFGHIRDLPSKDGSVQPDDDFSMVWETDSKSAKRMKEIADAVKASDELILATDPDREGEAISWHVLEALKNRHALKDVEIKRVVFNAITKASVLEAMDKPRELDMELVEAYLARRALDYLVGFNLSPVLWRKLPGARSAGRVQSVALKIITDREIEIETFKPQEYWRVLAQLKASNGQNFEARLFELDGKKLQKFTLNDEVKAKAALAVVETGEFTISSVEAKPTRRNPPPPFMTSTLQQEASRKFGFGADQTMRIAQQLYEGSIAGQAGGLITYMRTDGVDLAPEALHQARDLIDQSYGGQYLPEKPRVYKTKAKNAQEAHEAIRPTNFSVTPKSSGLSGDHLRLYTLIWNRALASQMEAAVFERTSADLKNLDKRAILRATGQVMKFDGYLKLYTESFDDDRDDTDDGRLPPLNEGDKPALEKVAATQHFTEPPPRYTEASLVKRLEELGIGRPSTYASIIQVLLKREYVRLDQKRFFPEDKGRLVTAFLESFFTKYVQYEFTADLEDRLDLISSGDLPWKTLLRDFWLEFQAAIDETKDLRVSAVLDALNELIGSIVFPLNDEGVPQRACPKCDSGELSLKIGRYGAFVGCSNYPDCAFTKPFGGDAESGQGGSGEDVILGQHPETGYDIALKSGRFGPYVEHCEADNKKPPRASLPKGWTPYTLDLPKALKLLALPRPVGEHPDEGGMISAAIGRYGPYVEHNKTYANLSNVDDVWEIGLNRAVTLIAEKRAKGPGRRGKATPERELGEHPKGGVIGVYNGRYGPYVKYEKTNATLPKNITIETVTLEQAIELIDNKAGKPKKKTTRKKAKK